MGAVGESGGGKMKTLSLNNKKKIKSFCNVNVAASWAASQ